MQDFGKRLYNVLIWKGITQTKFAKLINVNKTAVTQWIQGKTYPKLEKFCKICKILNITPNYFLGYES